MAAPIPPFTAADVAICRSGLDDCVAARDLLEKAKKCGAPCEQDAQMLDAIQESLNAYRAHFTEPSA